MKCSIARLRTLRLIAGYTQYELASKIGRGQCWVSFVERGIAKPSRADIASIRQALGIPPGSLGELEERRQILTGREVSRLPGLRGIIRYAPPATRFLLLTVPDTALMVLIPMIPGGTSRWLRLTRSALPVDTPMRTTGGGAE